MQSRVLAVLLAASTVAGCDRLYGVSPHGGGDDDGGHDGGVTDTPGQSSGCSNMGMLKNDLTTSAPISPWWILENSGNGEVDFQLANGDATIAFMGQGTTPTDVTLSMRAGLDLREDTFAIRLDARTLPVTAGVSLNLVDARGRLLGMKSVANEIVPHATLDSGADTDLSVPRAWDPATQPVWRISYRSHEVLFEIVGDDQTTTVVARSTLPTWVGFVRAVLTVQTSGTDTFTFVAHPLDGTAPTTGACKISQLIDSFDALTPAWGQLGNVTFDSGFATMHETSAAPAVLASTTVWDLRESNVAIKTMGPITSSGAAMGFTLTPLDNRGPIARWTQSEAGTVALYDGAAIDTSLLPTLAWGFHLTDSLLGYDQGNGSAAMRTSAQHLVDDTGFYDRVLVEIGAFPSGSVAPNSELAIDSIGPQP